MMFTVEEENLCCVFDISSRTVLIGGIRDTMTDCEDMEILEIADSTLRKLEAMTDAEFDALDFSPAYNNVETEV